MFTQLVIKDETLAAMELVELMKKHLKEDGVDISLTGCKVTQCQDVIEKHNLKNILKIPPADSKEPVILFDIPLKEGSKLEYNSYTGADKNKDWFDINPCITLRRPQ